MKYGFISFDPNSGTVNIIELYKTSLFLTVAVILLPNMLNPIVEFNLWGGSKERIFLQSNQKTLHFL